MMKNANYLTLTVSMGILIAGCGGEDNASGETAGAEIWISNIASDTKPAYRALTFSEGEFSAKDGTPLEISKESDMRTVSAKDGGHFRFADAVITGG